MDVHAMWREKEKGAQEMTSVTLSRDEFQDLVDNVCLLHAYEFLLEVGLFDDDNAKETLEEMAKIKVVPVDEKSDGWQWLTLPEVITRHDSGAQAQLFDTINYLLAKYDVTMTSRNGMKSLVRSKR